MATSVRRSLSLSPAYAKRIEEIAKEKGINGSEVLREAVMVYTQIEKAKRAALVTVFVEDEDGKKQEIFVPL